MSHKTETIRKLNDQLRTHGTGNGMVIITQGVQALGDVGVSAALDAVRDFSDFTADNDPYGEHDFGSFKVSGERLFFKIDYYDRSLTNGSSDPSDPNLTKRVLTIMLAEEY